MNKFRIELEFEYSVYLTTALNHCYAVLMIPRLPTALGLSLPAWNSDVVSPTFKFVITVHLYSNEQGYTAIDARHLLAVPLILG